MKGILTLSSKEIDRLMLIQQIEQQRLSVLEAADLLWLSQRQLYRILKWITAEGSKGIIHNLRGRKSNRGYPEVLKKEIIKIHRKRYPNYGPTLFSEMLIEYYNISLNRESVRIWLRKGAITTSMRKKKAHRRKRERRTCYRDVLQFDGSHHDWFVRRNSPEESGLRYKKPANFTGFFIFPQCITFHFRSL